MKFSVITALVALAAGVSAWSNETVHYTTEVVTAYTTYCPGPTQITHGDVTYTITSATTLTITNCPCTITKPVTSAVITKCSTCAAPTSKPYSNSTVSVPPAGTGAPPSKTSAPPAFTGAANNVAAGAGAGLAAVFGIALYLL